MGRVVPYTVGGPTAALGLPTDTPTRATGRRYGWNALYGILTAGNLAAVIPLNKSTPGQWQSASFPYVTPSSVAPNAIRVAIVVALNLFSPNHHSTPASVQQPVPAEVPTHTMGPNSYQMPKKHMHGTGGWYTLPHPPNFPNWPEFIDRMQR